MENLVDLVMGCTFLSLTIPVILYNLFQPRPTYTIFFSDIISWSPFKRYEKNTR